LSALTPHTLCSVVFEARDKKKDFSGVFIELAIGVVFKSAHGVHQGVLILAIVCSEVVQKPLLEHPVEEHAPTGMAIAGVTSSTSSTSHWAHR
jgi:hypothetical protein